MPSFEGVPTISDDLEFGIPKVPFYFVRREAMIVGFLLLVEAILCIMVIESILLFLVFAVPTGIGLPVLFMQFRERYGQAWLFDMRMRLRGVGGIGDGLGILGPASGAERVLTPQLVPDFCPFRGNERDLGCVDPEHALFAPLDHRPYRVDRQGLGRVPPAGLGQRLEHARLRGLENGRG